MIKISFLALVLAAFVAQCFGQGLSAELSLVAPRPRQNLCKVNICFAFDESGSVSNAEFATAKTAASAIAASVGSGSIYSAVDYSNSASVVQSVTNSLPLIQSRISTNPKGFGLTYSDAGLEACKKQLLSSTFGAPSPKVLVLLTDGHDAHLNAVITKAAEIKGLGIHIITVNIDSSSSASGYNAALSNIASDPSLAVYYNTYSKLLGTTGLFTQHICNNCCRAANICYAIDESGSISSSEYTTMINAIVSVTSAHNLLAPGSTYAATGFNNLALPITASTSAASLTNALYANNKASGTTSSGRGIRQCASYLSSQPGLKIIIVLTDGYDNVPPYGEDVAAIMSASGYQFITVGIGNGVNDVALSNIAHPNPFIKVSDFDSIYEAVGPILRGLCDARSKTKIVRPSPVPMKPSTCINIICTACGLTQECFIRSGNQNFDRRVCKFISSRTDRSVATAFGRCQAKYTTVNCTPGRVFGVYATGDSPSCLGSKSAPVSFHRMIVCTDKTGDRFTFSCGSGSCSGRDKKCWPSKLGSPSIRGF